DISYPAFSGLIQGSPLGESFVSPPERLSGGNKLEAKRKNAGQVPGASSYHVGSVAIAADAHADAGRADADARARPLIQVATAIGAALAVALARRVIVGIGDDHAPAAADAIATTAFVADHPDLLHQIRVCIFARDVDVCCPGAAGGERGRSSQQCNRKYPHS